MILQSYLLSKNGGPLKTIPIRGVSPEVLLRGKAAYRLARIKYLLPKAINTIVLRRESPLENWNKWLSVTLRDTIDQLLFSGSPRIRDYLEPACISSLKDRPTDPVIAKLATAEIILRLIENKWQRLR